MYIYIYLYIHTYIYMYIYIYMYRYIISKMRVDHNQSFRLPNRMAAEPRGACSCRGSSRDCRPFGLGGSNMKLVIDNHR